MHFSGLVQEDQKEATEKLNDVLEDAVKTLPVIKSMEIRKPCESHVDKASRKPLDVYCSTETRCPKCWLWDDDKKECTINKKELGCWELKCGHDKMNIRFKSELLDVKDNQTPNPFVHIGEDMTNIPLPIWDEDMWKLECSLGSCGMKVNDIIVDDHISMTISLSSLPRVREEAYAVEADGNLLYFNGLHKLAVDFHCLYSSTVKVTSDAANLELIDWGTSGEVIQHGSLKSGFSLKLFVDQAMETPIGLSDLFIGSTVFAEVKWTIESLSKLLVFFIETCDVAFETGRITIIKNTCYGSALGTQSLNTKGGDISSSKFKFLSFLPGGGASQIKMKLECQLRVCDLKKKECFESIITTQNDCEQGEMEYKTGVYPFVMTEASIAE